MELIINNRAVELNIGVRFLRELDRKFFVEREGFKLGFGLRQIQIDLEMGNYAKILVDMIEAGTRNSVPYKPTTEDIENYIDSVEDYDGLIDQFNQELASANATKKAWAEILEEANPAEPQVEVSTEKHVTVKKATKK